MSAGLATPCSTMRMASRPNTTPRRDEAKPGESLTTIGCFPIRVTASRARARKSSPVRSCRTSSTSFMICTGLKKCMPSTRSGRVVAAAMAATESEEVFVARTAEETVSESSRAKRSLLIPRSSITASMTRSASVTAASRSPITSIRLMASLALPSVILPRVTPPSRFSSIRAGAASSTAALLSVSAVS